MIFFIVSRLLFIASMVFIIGYVFGPFSRNNTLRTITKIASILAVVLFIGMNIFFLRAARHNNLRNHAGYECPATKQ